MKHERGGLEFLALLGGGYEKSENFQKRWVFYEMSRHQ